MMQRDTACLHGYKHQTDETGAINLPIFQSSTFRHPSTTHMSDYIYSRVKNPTREAVENTVAMLEGAAEGFGFASGMAAIATIMELFEPGAHIISTADLFGGTIRLFTSITNKHGLAFDFIDTSDISALKSTLKPNTKGIYIETPSNPMTIVTDIAAVKEAIKDRDIIIIVDNTLLSPYLQNPMALGADIVIHSGTKYLGGHSDALAGFAVLNDEKLREKLQGIHTSIGATLAPLDAFLVQRGIKTLALRVEKMQQNAITIANWLKAHPKVKSVNYPGLPGHLGHEIMKKQSRGFGALMSFEVDTEETARNVVEKTKIITYAESLGCVNSLITLPILATHADVPEAERLARGINGKLVRFSVGIENAQDLIVDLEQSLCMT